MLKKRIKKKKKTKRIVRHMRDITISFSQIYLFLKCRYAWNLSYRRQISRFFVHVPMDKGSAIHDGVAGALIKYAYASSTNTGRRRTRQPAFKIKRYTKISRDKIHEWGRIWLKDHGATPENADTIDKIVTQSCEISDLTLENFDMQRWRALWYNGKPLIEQELMVQVRPWKGFRTFPDLCAEDLEDGGNFVLDWKSRSQFTNLEDEEVNMQFASMQYVLLQHDIPTDGSITYQIRSTPPSQPKLNKDESMSRVRIATTWDVYQKALIAAELDPDDYEEEMKPKLDVKFHQFDRHYRGEEELESIWENVVLPAAADMSSNPRIIRAMGSMNCRGCHARQFCLADLRGEDTEFLLKTQYIDKNRPRKRIILNP